MPQKRIQIWVRKKGKKRLVPMRTRLRLELGERLTAMPGAPEIVGQGWEGKHFVVTVK